MVSKIYLNLQQENIHTYLAVYQIPIANLIAPEPELLVRNVSQDAVEQLATEIETKSINLSNPLVCIVDGIDSMDAVTDEVIQTAKAKSVGGNHRRCAIELLLERGVTLPKTISSYLCCGKF